LLPPADSFEPEKIILWFHFAYLKPRIRLGEMKAARKKTGKPSRLLEVAIDVAMVIVIGYALILLSQSKVLF
jgi:hypothetical protein